MATDNKQLELFQDKELVTARKLNTVFGDIALALEDTTNVQSDWSQTDNTADDYIKNKPAIPTKTTDLTNDSGFITEEALFWCTYGTTTYADITTAINNGKLPVVKYLDRIYRLTCAEGNFQIGLTHHHFEAVIGEISYYVRVSNLNTWHANAYTLAKSSDIPDVPN